MPFAVINDDSPGSTDIGMAEHVTLGDWITGMTAGACGSGKGDWIWGWAMIAPPPPPNMKTTPLCSRAPLTPVDGTIDEGPN